MQNSSSLEDTPLLEDRACRADHGRIGAAEQVVGVDHHAGRRRPSNSLLGDAVVGAWHDGQRHPVVHFVVAVGRTRRSRPASLLAAHDHDAVGAGRRCRSRARSIGIVHALAEHQGLDAGDDHEVVGDLGSFAELDVGARTPDRRLRLVRRRSRTASSASGRRLSSMITAETPSRSSVFTVETKCSGLPPVSPSNTIGLVVISRMSWMVCMRDGEIDRLDVGLSLASESVRLLEPDGVELARRHRSCATRDCSTMRPGEPAVSLEQADERLRRRAGDAGARRRMAGVAPISRSSG